MPTYTKLSEDEKNSIRESTTRSLEFQMYALELDLTAENAKVEPNAERVEFLISEIAQKEAQITAVNN